MKKIIGNLLYDTDKSTLIYEDKNVKRQYYKTENGRYFCLYANGIMHPIDEETIKNILGEYDIAAYISIFGEPKEA